MEFLKFKRAIHAQFNQLAAGGHKRYYDSLPDEEKDNWCWANFNRVGCARIRNTAIGTLLVNISSGLELDDCVTALLVN